MDRGEYIRIGQLAPSSAEEELLRGYTYRHADSSRRNASRTFSQAEIHPKLKQRYEEGEFGERWAPVTDAQPVWKPRPAGFPKL